MSPPTRRRLLQTVGLGLSGSMAGCSLLDDQRATPSADRPDADRTATATATPTDETPACDAFSYEPTLHEGATDTPESYLTIVATVDVADPPPMVGYVAVENERRRVFRALQVGDNEFRFGPYEHDAVSYFDFWLRGCGPSPTPTDA